MTRAVKRGRGQRRDRGSLPLAMLLTLVGVSLSTLLAPVVVQQMTATRTSSERLQALHAAQAGIDTALGQIRAASDGAGNGVLEGLPPCVLTGSLSPDSTLSPPRYRVTITYRNADGNAMTCPPWDVPTTASLVATGTETPGGTFGVGTPDTRTIEATYSFRTTNANITGGAIPIAVSNTSPLCMDAGTDNTPTTGDRLRMQPCQPGASDQRFGYTEDLNVKILGSESTLAPAGMCLDAGSPQATNAYVVFRPCLGRTARHQWSLDDVSNFQGTNDGVNLNGLCFNLQNPHTPGSYVILGGCRGSNVEHQRVFRPEPAVGAGMAGQATGQLVNYKQFSRCLDVTNTILTWPYMIVWFCKQAPDGNINWNQKWSYPTVTVPAVSATGRIRTNGYCLRSPGSTASNQYASMTACSATGTLPVNLQWTVYGDTGDYTTSYRIVDGYGYCLTPTDLDAPSPDRHSDGTAKTKVATCSGAELQKWNAPPYIKRPIPLTDIIED